MLRSFINQTIREAIEFIQANGFHLPPFARMTYAQWKEAGEEYAEVYDNLLGWDVTDFGSGTMDSIGLVAFTIRNGNLSMADRYPKPYAEKLLLSHEGQQTPMHFHHKKTEDIIVRSGGNMLMQLYNATEEDALADTPVMVQIDGRSTTVQPGETLCFRPGESITLPPRLYHAFWAEPGSGRALIGEVSSVNDDTVDNRFLLERERFTGIEEDEPIHIPLAVDVRALHRK